EDQDEAPDSRARDLVGALVARSFPRSRSASGIIGSLHKHEQPANPTVSAFFYSPQPNHKSYRISDGSAVSRHKTRMYARRTRHRRVHHRPDQPLRPLGDETAGIRHDTAFFDAHSAGARGGGRSPTVGAVERAAGPACLWYLGGGRRLFRIWVRPT